MSRQSGNGIMWPYAVCGVCGSAARACLCSGVSKRHHRASGCCRMRAGFLDSRVLVQERWCSFYVYSFNFWGWDRSPHVAALRTVRFISFAGIARGGVGGALRSCGLRLGAPNKPAYAPARRACRCTGAAAPGSRDFLALLGLGLLQPAVHGA